MTVDATDALDLLDWKRQIFALYESVRSNSDPRSAWRHWLETRDRLFREHPQSPLPVERRAAFLGCNYFDYDPSARVVARVETSEPERCDVASSTGAALPFSKVGTAHFVYAGDERSLPLLWNEGYGGGVFVSFQDKTSGRETYPAARYLLDTVKGADLGADGGRLVFDFNFAYNPSCAYDALWSCPLALAEDDFLSRCERGSRARPRKPGRTRCRSGTAPRGAS